MVKNLKGEDKANYIKEFEETWQKRLKDEYETKKTDLKEKIDYLNSMISENSPSI